MIRLCRARGFNNQPSPRFETQRTEAEIDEFISQYVADLILNPQEPADVFAEFEWLEQMDGVVTLKASTADLNQNHIGYCDAKLIRRNRMRSFYDEMEQPTTKTATLAFELFDR